MAWRWGQERNYAPTRLLPRVQVQVDGSAFVIDHRAPTVGEVAEVRSRLEGDAGHAVRQLAETGARVSEVCDLAPYALDLPRKSASQVGATGFVGPARPRTSRSSPRTASAAWWSTAWPAAASMSLRPPASRATAWR
jgi:hypothetical protein